MRKVLTIVTLPYLLIHILVRFISTNRKVFSTDQVNNLKYRANPYTNKILQFAYFLLWLPEYRSVFYKRLGWVGKLLSLMLPGQSLLYLRTNKEKIASGFVIIHGNSTGILAQSIGKNCTVHQNVTIGTNGSIYGPIIQDNVYVGNCSVIIGNIVIGRNVQVGAGSVVRNSIPPYAVVMGSPAKIVGFSKTPEEIIDYEKTLYPEDERLPIDLLEKNYKKYFLDHIKEIKAYTGIICK